MNKLLLPILLLLSLPLVFQSTPTEILKLKIFDSLVAEQEPSGYFTILNISEEDVRERGGWPFPRKDLAQLQLDILSEGAIGIGWVVSFSETDRFGGDEFFSTALELGPTVLAMFESSTGSYPPTTGTVVLGNDVGGYMSPGIVENVDVLKEQATQGIASAPVDIDNLVRRIPLLMKTPEGWAPSFGTQVLKILAGSNTYIIKTNDNGLEEIVIKGLAPIPVDNYGRKWISWVDTPQTTLEEMDVEGKFVFIGITANGIMPQIATPSGLLEPHKIQAALSESILIENSPHIPDFAIALEILIFSIFVTLTWLSINFLGITKGVSVAVVLLLTTALSGFFSIQKGYLIDFSWTFISQFITGAIAFYLNFRKQFKLRQQIKKQFEHYLDPRQVKKLQDNPKLLKLGGERRRCTFLFTDVRGFTSLSETLEPEEVTEIMNKVLTIQANAVKFYDGMVDKYIGDAMMAIFNAPIDLDKHEEAAVLCAKEIQDRVKLSGLGIEIGVGVNTGFAVIGNMGSDTRFDYTAIGDAVNIGARLESGTKEAGVDLLIGYNTAIKSDYSLRKLEPLKVKGKEKSLQVYTWE